MLVLLLFAVIIGIGGLLACHSLFFNLARHAPLKW